jgi:citrate synthase
VPHDLRRMSEVQSGLEGVVAFATEIAEPDEEGSALRGIDIEDVIGRTPFEQVWGLLVDGTPKPRCRSRSASLSEAAPRT